MLGNDVFVSLPTGSGKSLFVFGCYPALSTSSERQPLYIVISPLVALMKEQVQILTLN